MLFAIPLITILFTLLISYLARKSKFKNAIWGLCAFLALIPIIFVIMFIWATSQTDDFKTLSCGTDKFYYVKTANSGENGYFIAKNGNKYSLNDSIISDLVKKNNSYSALYNLPPDLDKTKDFAQLLNCKEFDLNAMYQPYQLVNPDNLSEIRDKDRCYLLNRTGEKDYPECSPEIKAKFELR